MLYTFAESVSQVLDHENNLRPYYQHVIWQEHYTLLGTFCAILLQFVYQFHPVLTFQNAEYWVLFKRILSFA